MVPELDTPLQVEALVIPYVGLQDPGHGSQYLALPGTTPPYRPGYFPESL